MTTAQAAAWSGVGSAITSIYAGKAAGYGYEAQAYARKAQAQQAESAAEMTNLKLMQNFNDMMAANVVMGAMSGRSFSSPTIQNIARADREQLAWDIEYSTLSGKIGKTAGVAEATGYESAAKQATFGAAATGILKGFDTYVKYKQIG